ncbi:MAG: copper transport protein [Geoglossum simile]|nr:MAG: copper transport protein [Geoglossum simile]
MPHCCCPHSFLTGRNAPYRPSRFLFEATCGERFPTVDDILGDAPWRLAYPFSIVTSGQSPYNHYSVFGLGEDLEFSRYCFSIRQTDRGTLEHNCLYRAVFCGELIPAKVTLERVGTFCFPFHRSSMALIDNKNPLNSSSLTLDNNKYVVLLKLICTLWESYFLAPTLLEPYVYTNMDARVTNLITLTQSRPEARSALGFHLKTWERIYSVFREGIVALMQGSFPQANPLSPTVNGTSSALISANFTTLLKNIERLTDLCTVARNMLATKELAQDLASLSRVEKQIMMLIDTSVRVTARGYDGPIDGCDRQSQERWQKVVKAYKRLLVMCLQFLHNFIMHNENRKLQLWMDLFGHSVNSDPLLVGPAMENLRQRTLDNDGILNGTADVDKGKLIREFDAVTNEIKEFGLSSDGVSPPNDAAASEPVTEAQPSSSDQSSKTVASKSRNIIDELEKFNVDDTVDFDNLPEFVKETVAEPVPVIEMEVPPASGASSNLEGAKKRLMERIRDSSQMHPREDRDGDNGYDGGISGVSDEASDGGDGDDEDGDDDEDDEEGEDESYRGPGDQERGLLTDIPLVLAPAEIDALPMILQVGIVPQYGDKIMQNARCNILLAQESGRNLLRELLIFIAAWDLPDDETYFKLMLQIIEAILENGLMPLAYTTFGEAKDIISPAQAVMLKILTQIFRNKHSGQANDLSTIDTHDPPTGLHDIPNSPPTHTPPSHFDTMVIKFVFSVFRQTVIPQTCALIFLQGQIRGAQATAEDFPLNLWDMERVYEGVYQFLEFFAVLAEYPAWKKLLVEWEIVHELVSLLKELESGIPKASLDKAGQRPPGAPPGLSTPQQPAPAIVERPYDPTTNENGTPAEVHDVEEDDGQATHENPDEFEWRNLKKLVVLVLSSLVWKSTEVQDQVRKYGGVEAVLGCCSYDGNNPYIREHAIMCLRFLLEANAENQQIVRELEARQVVPSEVLDKRAYETFIDLSGRVGLRRKGGAPMS